MPPGTDEITERRRFARLDIPIRVEYRLQTTDCRPETADCRPKTTDHRLQTLKTEKMASTKNISAGGCLLMTSEELPLNSEIELDIFLGDGESEMLKLKGSIVRLNRSDKKNFEYGISFSGMSSGARRLFADFCFAKMYELIGLSDWPTAKKKNVSGI